MNVDSYQNTELNRFQSDTTLSIIGNPKNLDELENEWERFNLMTVEHRRISNQKSIELFGMTNQDRYEAIKSSFLKKDFDIEDIPLDEAVEDDHIEFSNIKYPDWAGEVAENWGHSAMRTIIYPVDDLDKLEKLWIDFNNMHLKLRRESDWKSMELFGIDNKTHYEFLKSKFLKQDIEEDLPESPIEEECREIMYGNLSDIEKMSRCLKLSNVRNTTYCENILIQTTIDNTIESFKDNICNTTTFSDDLPWFTPEEMEQFGALNKDNSRFSIESDNSSIGEGVSVSDWFKNYKLLYSGIYTENTPRYTKLWINKLQELYYDYNKIKEDGNIEKINARKQSILDLGWNPDFDFTPENRLIASKRIKDLYNMKKSNIDIVDISHFDIEEDDNTLITEMKDTNILYPIFIVLVEGTSLFSAAIKSFTKSVFSHAAIGLDTKLDNLYSYNIREGGGLTYESIKEYNKNSRLGVFSIFVREIELRKIRKALDYYIDNKDKTKYSFLNVLSLPLNIPVEFDLKMICSQFVDRILKMANIDITHKTSSLVVPNSFAAEAENNNKIYKLYRGTVGEYKAGKINRILRSMHGKEKYIKEFYNTLDETTMINSICENITDPSKLIGLSEHMDILNENAKKIINNIAPSIDPYIVEAKEFPVKFDEDGNLLIKSINKIDFEREYSKSHKLLLAYHKSKDLEGIKYELSRLWFLNHIIEKRLHNTRYKKNTNEYYKVRARILNDFNKYIEIVMNEEKTFNFAKYYESSPFSDAAYKLDKSTLKYTGRLLKNIIF